MEVEVAMEDVWINGFHSAAEFLAFSFSKINILQKTYNFYITNVKIDFCFASFVPS